MVITLLNKSGRKMEEHNEDGLQQRENIKKNQLELKNSKNEIYWKESKADQRMQNRSTIWKTG